MRLPDHIKGFPSLPLQRPFKLFGKGFEVKLSSHLTMQPETVLWIYTGLSLQQTVESVSTDHGRALKAVQRAVIGKTKLSQTTLRLVARSLLHQVQAGITLEELLGPMSSKPSWKVVQDAMREAAESDLYDIVRHLAELEELPSRYRALIASDNHEYAAVLLRTKIGHPEKYWGCLNIHVSCYLVVDTALQVIASAEWNWRNVPEDFRRTHRSPASALIETGKKPLRHWLVKQQELVGLKSLGQLSKQLPADCGITLERLTDWSAGRNLLPPSAANELLNMLHASTDAEAEMKRYRLARLFSFLTEFVICAVEGEAPPWPTAQAMIQKRYCELLELAIPKDHF